MREQMPHRIPANVNEVGTPIDVISSLVGDESPRWLRHPPWLAPQQSDGGDAASAGGGPGQGDGAEFISIPEWSRRLSISPESGYKAARQGQIPGCFAIGRLYRVNWPAFVERTRAVGGEQVLDELGGVPVATFDRVHRDR
jgi:hypothetical protein